MQKLIQVLICFNILLIAICANAQTPTATPTVTPVFTKSDGVLYSDTNETGLLDVGDTVKFEIDVTNPSVEPMLIDITDSLPTGLDNLNILQYPQSITYNPNPIKTISFKFDTYGTTGPAKPLPNLSVRSICPTNSNFAKNETYGGVLSGLDTGVTPNDRYYGFCSELNQSIGLSTHSMSLYHSPISAPLYNGNGQVISIEQKMMIQGIFYCLGICDPRTMTSTTVQDVTMAFGVQGEKLKTITNYQAAAAQIAIWEIVHEPWTNGTSTPNLTSGIITWKIKVNNQYTLPTDFINTFNNLISCAKSYVLMMGATPSIASSTHNNLVVESVNLQPSASTKVVFTAILNEEAADGHVIVNTACADSIACGDSFTVCDSGQTQIVKSQETPTPPDDFCATAYIINTKAGIGKPGYNGDGLAANQSRMWYPIQACVDQNDNLYVADYSNHIVRKIDAVTGIMTIVAGTAQVRGYTGNGGLATAATLSNPSDVFVRNGALYIADLGNSAIRRVDFSTGIITTVAGNGTEGYSGDNGLATAAQINRPRSVYVDVAGNIYIADTFNFCIRMVDAATGIIITFAGNGIPGHAADGDIATSTSLEWIHDITMRSDGILYFSEQNGYNLVRRIVERRIETVAGKHGVSTIGDCGYAIDSYLNKPYGIAFDTFDNLYIADEKNHKIRKIDALTDLITTVAGTGVAGYNGDNKLGIEAQLNQPSGVVIDSKNMLYICDRYNMRVRSMNLMDPRQADLFPDIPSGNIEVVAGTGTAGYNGEGTDAAKQLLSAPGGVTVDGNGNIIIADRSNHRIRKVNTDGSISTIAGSGSPRGYSGDGGAATAAKLNFPNDIAFDGNGNLYIADQSNNAIRKIDTAGIITTLAGNGTAGFAGDGGLAVNALLSEPDSLEVFGNVLYVTDKANHRLRAIDLTTGIITTVAGNGTRGKGAENVNPLTTPLDTPRGISISASGDIYIAASGAHIIKKISGGLISSFAGNGLAGFTGDAGVATAAKLNTPVDVVVTAGGLVYIADYRNHAVRMVDLTGNMYTVAGNGTAGFAGNGGPAASALLNYPVGIAANLAGDVFVADRLNNEIRIIKH